MNNSFERLVDGMCATLRQEVLTRLDDDFARGQVYGVINLLNTFKARADWSAGFLLQQIDAQRQALDTAATVLAGIDQAPAVPVPAVPEPTPIADLLALRDQGNRTLAAVQAWLDDEGGRARLPAGLSAALDQALMTAMRAELEIELRHSPRPLFAEMSGGG